MTDWKPVAEEMWNALLGKISELRSQGMTMEEIAKIIGVSGKAIISQWLAGVRKAENTSFTLFMTYVERAGLDYNDFFPKDSRNALGNCRHRVKELEAEVKELQAYRYKWEGYIESLAAQGAGAMKKTAS